MPTETLVNYDRSLRNWTETFQHRQIKTRKHNVMCKQKGSTKRPECGMGPDRRTDKLLLVFS